jgi:hypothetical protein
VQLHAILLALKHDVGVDAFLVLEIVVTKRFPQISQFDTPQL